MKYIQKYFLIFSLTANLLAVASMDPSKLPPKKRPRTEAADQEIKAAVFDAVNATVLAMTGLPSDQSAPAADGGGEAPQLDLDGLPSVLDQAFVAGLLDDGIIEEPEQEDDFPDEATRASFVKTRREVDLLVAKARAAAGSSAGSSSSAAAAAVALPQVGEDDSESGYSDVSEKRVDRPVRGGGSVRGRGHLKCCSCSRRFNHQQDRTYHEMRCPSRSVDRAGMLMCHVHEGCPEGFMQKAARTRHEQHCRWNGRGFLCQFCTNCDNTSEKSFKRHLKVVHSKSLADVSQLGKQ